MVPDTRASNASPADDCDRPGPAPPRTAGPLPLHLRVYCQITCARHLDPAARRGGFSGRVPRRKRERTPGAVQAGAPVPVSVTDAVSDAATPVCTRQTTPAFVKQRARVLLRCPHARLGRPATAPSGPGTDDRSRRRSMREPAVGSDGLVLVQDGRARLDRRRDRSRLNAGAPAVSVHASPGVPDRRLPAGREAVREPHAGLRGANSRVAVRQRFGSTRG
jgi:hypothetical protein